MIFQSGMSNRDVSHGSTKDCSPINSGTNRNILIFPISFLILRKLTKGKGEMLEQGGVTRGRGGEGVREQLKEFPGAVY